MGVKRVLLNFISWPVIFFSNSGELLGGGCKSEWGSVASELSRVKVCIPKSFAKNLKRVKLMLNVDLAGLTKYKII